MVDRVVETPNGAHFTTCTPDYERDEKFQRPTRQAGGTDEEAGRRSSTGSCPADEADYQAAVAAFAEEQEAKSIRGRPAPRSAPSPSPSCSATTARSWAARWDAADARRPAGQADVRTRPRAHRRRVAVPGRVPRPSARQGAVEGWMPFRRVFETLAYGKRHVMMGATQIDRHGNQNISAIGDCSTRPGSCSASAAPRATRSTTARATGSASTPPGSSCEHGRRRLRRRPGQGRPRPTRPYRFVDVHRVVTNLGVFDFGGPGRHACGALSVHPGVTVDEVRENTRFERARLDDAGPQPGSPPARS